MNRFLLAYVLRDPLSPIIYSPEVFKVTSECSQYDVTLPTNTLFFTFAHADVETEKELAESFFAIKLGNNATKLSCTLPIENEENGKRYWIGTLVTINGTKCVVNKKTHTITPVSLFGDNYEVIDL